MIILENKKLNTFVMLVDDNSIDNFVNTKVIDRYQFADEVILFKKSRKALEYLSALNTAPESQVPDVLFLDLNMPDINGLIF